MWGLPRRLSAKTCYRFRHGAGKLSHSHWRASRRNHPASAEGVLGSSKPHEATEGTHTSRRIHKFPCESFSAVAHAAAVGHSTARAPRLNAESDCAGGPRSAKADRTPNEARTRWMSRKRPADRETPPTRLCATRRTTCPRHERRDPPARRTTLARHIADQRCAARQARPKLPLVVTTPPPQAPRRDMHRSSM